MFYSDPEYTIGQIVIASRESQYKILHFHHGGLDKLAEIFQDWSLFATSHDKVCVYLCSVKPFCCCGSIPLYQLLNSFHAYLLAQSSGRVNFCLKCTFLKWCI